MSDSIITVENLGKRYSLSHLRDQRYIALRDVLVEKATGLFRRNGKARSQKSEVSSQLSSSPSSKEDFWALKDVSFEVKQGEVVGIIGRNGAGKSTLLKILSRITEPTEGRVRLKGRVASLLEVGTGFHPELTGRENIYLNGAILGMSRDEIRKKFDEIVAFAETEKFLDTPVKRYSSGMYVRLAFAVAAHLEPEILVVDEVLAVGDAEFQRKCLGKMKEVSRGGRTVLFVSHNMAAVEGLCSTAIVLSKGSIVAKGDPPSMVHAYISQRSPADVERLDVRADREGTGDLRFVNVTIEMDRGTPSTSLPCGADVTLVIDCRNNSGRELRNVRIAVGVDTEMDQRVLLLDTNIVGQEFAAIPIGEGRLHISLPKLSLMPGSYHFTLYSTVNGVITDWIKSAGSFDVEGGDYFGSGQLPPHGQGIFVAAHSFRYEPCNRAAPFEPLGRTS